MKEKFQKKIRKIQKFTVNIIHTIRNKLTVKEVRPLKSENNKRTDHFQMANKFNDYFTSLFTNERLENMPVPIKMFEGNQRLNEIELSEL